MSEFHLNDASLTELESRLKDCPPRLTEVTRRELLFECAFAAGKNAARHEKRIWQTLAAFTGLVCAGLLFRLNSIGQPMVASAGHQSGSATGVGSEEGRSKSINARPNDSVRLPGSETNTAPSASASETPPIQPAPRSIRPQVPSIHATPEFASRFASPRRINLDAWQLPDDATVVLYESLRRFQGMSADERQQTVIGLHSIDIK